jgi:hypothetical protein
VPITEDLEGRIHVLSALFLKGFKVVVVHGDLQLLINPWIDALLSCAGSLQRSSAAWRVLHAVIPIARAAAASKGGVVRMLHSWTPFL